jgi:hypothetical protein
MAMTATLVSAVTKENYVDLAMAFIGINKHGAMIALRSGINQGEKFEATPRQWGAWRAYLKTRGISTAFMDSQGKAWKCWTVPAEWPHLFDMEATVADDYAAGDRFMAGYREENPVYADMASRLAQVAKWTSQKLQMTPKEHLRAPPSVKDYHMEGPATPALRQMLGLQDESTQTGESYD